MTISHQYNAAIKTNVILAKKVMKCVPTNYRQVTVAASKTHETISYSSNIINSKNHT